MIGRTVGHYRILERLGGGGMGVVYKAEDTKLGRVVALKFLPPELTRDADAKSRFLREARAASLLDHTNICTIYDIGETDDEQTFIAMACYDGETLKARIERGPLEVDEALKLAEQIARGLGVAHEAGIVHRDIKPANVMLTAKGVAKILDFGLAKLTGATHITQSKTTLGTLAYMAPEQLRGDAVGPQADLWALGVVLFELLTGQRPFRGDYEQAMAYSILNEQPSSLLELKPDVPAELERIVKKLLRKDPLQRYQTAEELLAELETLRAPSSGSGKSGSRTSKPREPLRAGARLGPYEIAEPLGSGGMGDVYRARDTRLDRQVAIKVLAPEFSEDAERKQRFQREAKTISSLSHPNICTLFDVGEQEGTDYLVMEYLEGETLADRLTKGALPLNDVLKIGIQIGEALGAAHRQGVIHRDLKPGNVVLTKTGAIKLVDFGLAKDIGAVTSTPRHAQTPDKPLTAEGTIVGTLAYMAPEQVEGREADARTDIFAFGAILYEMATGRRAFEGATKASLIVAILEKEPALLAETRAAGESSARGIRSLASIEHVVRQCLEKDSEKRWDSARDVANELRWVAERGVQSPATTHRVQGQARRWRAAASAFALLFVAVIGSWIWRERRVSSALHSQATSIPRLVRLTWEMGNDFSPSLSPDGTSFVYVSGPAVVGTARTSDIYLRRIGGENAINLTKDHPGNDGAPAFSPDGKSIAFRSDRDGGGIFLMGATGESVRRLTEGGYGPAWSPDGKTIAYRSRAVSIWHGKGENALWLVDVAAGARRKILDGEASDLNWSPTGRRISFTRRRESSIGGFELCTIPAEGGEPRPILSALSGLGLAGHSWAGEWIWFWSATGGPHSLWRVRVDEATGALRSDPEIVFRGTEFGRELSVSRDSRKLLFASHPQKTMTLRWELDPVRLRLSDEPKTVLAGARGIFLYGGPSPDGEWLATFLVDHDDEEQQDIVLVRVTTGETRRLTDDLLREQQIRWAPDGSKLYFCVAPEGTSEVWSIRPDGSGRERVVPAIPGNDIESLSPSPDGRSLYVAIGKRFEPHVIDISVPIAQRRPVPLPAMGNGLTFSIDDYGSPDGRWLAGYPRKENGVIEPRLFLYDVAAKTYEQIADLKVLHAFDWLPDSRRLLLSARGELKVLDRVSGTITPVGRIDGGFQNGYLSRDGRWFYGTRDELEGDIWMLDYGDMVAGPKTIRSSEPGVAR